MSEELVSPFLETQLKCPACGSASPQRSFKSRIFLPEERESDQHVTGYRWMIENVQHVHPPYYFLYFCPKCFYTDITNEYTNIAANPFGKRVIKAYLEADKRRKLIVEFISRHINYDDIDFPSALNLHYLAIYIQMLLPEESRDSYKIARLLLRIAWLFREQTPDKEGNLTIPAVQDILERVDAFEGPYHTALGRVDGLIQALERRAAETEDVVSGDANPYRAPLGSIRSKIESISADLHKIKRACQKDLSGQMGGAEDGETYYTFASHDEYIEKLKSIWPLAPTDETEAMRQAIVYFDHSVSTDPRLSDQNKHFSAISLITDLKVRIGDLDGAYGMVRSIYKTAADNRTKSQKAMRDPETDEVEKRKLKAQIERAQSSISQVASLRSWLLDRLYERDKGKIAKVVNTMQGASPEDIESALEKAGIEGALIAKLKEKGKPLEFLAKKKSLFGRK
ncbi:MAG: DUF2225 domain-containing protein [Candidatus Sumerlaeota bacterium]